jgi:hypothetical protein
MQGDYKILQLEFVKTLLICFNSLVSARTPRCGSFEKRKKRTLVVKITRDHNLCIALWENKTGFNINAG